MNEIADAMQQATLADRIQEGVVDEPQVDNNGAQDANAVQEGDEESDQDNNSGPIYSAVVLGSDLQVYIGNSRAELATWYIQAKKHYDRMMKSGTPITWRSLIHPDKLCYIASWGLENPIEVSLLTDRQITLWIGQQIEAGSLEQINHIQAAMVWLKMEFTPGIPQSGVEKFVQDFESIHQKYRMNHLRESVDGRERLIIDHKQD